MLGSMSECATKYSQPVSPEKFLDVHFLFSFGLQLVNGHPVIGSGHAEIRFLIRIDRSGFLIYRRHIDMHAQDLVGLAL